MLRGALVMNTGHQEGGLKAPVDNTEFPIAFAEDDNEDIVVLLVNSNGQTELTILDAQKIHPQRGWTEVLRMDNPEPASAGNCYVQSLNCHRFPLSTVTARRSAFTRCPYGKRSGIIRSPIKTHVAPQH
jgi:hypothetical protein